MLTLKSFTLSALTALAGAGAVLAPAARTYAQAEQVTKEDYITGSMQIDFNTRTQKDTLAVFGGEYPGGALYTKAEWIEKNPKAAQAMATAIVNTLKWIHSHTPEEIMAKMPEALVGADKALYLAALKNTIPMFSQTGKMDPKGAQAVLAVFSQSSEAVAKANIDLSKTYTNKFVDQANAKTN